MTTTCRRDGNPLNTTAASSPSPLTSPPSSSEGPTAPATPGKSANGPSSQDGSQSKRSRKSRKTILIVAFVAIGVIVGIVGVLLVAMLLIRCCEKQSKLESTTMRPETGGYKGTKEKPKGNNSLIEHTAEANKGKYLLQFKLCGFLSFSFNCCFAAIKYL